MAAMHRYAYKLWKRLEERAEPDEVYGEGAPVFRGKLTEIWLSLGASQTHYSNVRAYLKTLGYIEIAEQGSRNRDTVIILHKEPPQDVDAETDDFTLERLTPAARFASIEDRVKVLEGFRESLAGGFNLANVLRDFENRISALEANTTNTPNAARTAETGD